MKYLPNLLIRIILVLIFPYNLLLYILTPTTIYLLYFFLLPYSPVIYNNTIQINNTTIKLIPACVAITAYSLSLILIIITKDISFKTRIKLLIYSFILILTMNIIRLLILSLLIIYKNINLFLTLHLFFWKFVASFYVALIWIYLTKKFKIKSIPIYSDYKHLIKFLKKK